MTQRRAPAASRSMRRISIASVIGTTIEWYDFFIFATASALVFNQAFFPNFDPVVGTLLAFGTFASSYLARLVGAAIFGHFGDRIGRKSMLLVSLGVMGGATFAIGLLPTYSSIGVWAPLLLLALRIIQGFAVAGEYGGAVLMTVEHAPHRRGFYGSLVQTAVPMGTLLANAVFLPIALLPGDALRTWGWRIPFLISIVLIGVGFYVRIRVEETPGFQAMKERKAAVRLPLLEVLRSYSKQVLLAGVAGLSAGVVFNVLVTSGLSYGTNTLKLSRGVMLTAALLFCAATAALIPWFGGLSDRYGARRVILGGLIAEAALIFPLFWLMETGTPPLVVIGYLLLAPAVAANYGPLATLLSDLFAERVRYSGMTIAYMLAGVLGAAATPVVTTALLAATGSGNSIAYYVIGAALASLVALLFLQDSVPAERRSVDDPPLYRRNMSVGGRNVPSEGLPQLDD